MPLSIIRARIALPGSSTLVRRRLSIAILTPSRFCPLNSGRPKGVQPRIQQDDPGRITANQEVAPKRRHFRVGDHPPRTPKIGASRGWKRALACSRHLSFRCPELNEGRLVRLGLRMSGGPDPRWAAVTCLEKLKLPAGPVLHIDHLFARMQRLNTYEAKTNAMTRIGSILSQVLPPPFSCE
jgi:hypothetical protein